MAAKSEPARESGDREIVATRLLDAPRDLVFRMWTEPNHVAQWWGPRGFTTTIREMDVRPGGVWHLIMRGPDGKDYHNRIVFIEVVKPERLVYKHEAEKGSEPVNFEVSVNFEEEERKTRLTMRMLFSSAAAREHIVKKYGAVEGLNQTLGRLEEKIADIAAAMKKELKLARIFDAPRELVFKAWTERDRVRQWWGPGGFTNPVCEIDPRTGGAIRIHMRAPNGDTHPMTGTFDEIASPERIVFTCAALDAAGNPMFEVVTTVILGEFGDKTEMTLHARVSKIMDPAAVFYIDGMDEGWRQSLDRLADEIAAKARK